MRLALLGALLVACGSDGGGAQLVATGGADAGSTGGTGGIVATGGQTGSTGGDGAGQAGSGGSATGGTDAGTTEADAGSDAGTEAGTHCAPLCPATWLTAPTFQELVSYPGGFEYRQRHLSFEASIPLPPAEIVQLYAYARASGPPQDGTAPPQLLGSDAGVPVSAGVSTDLAPALESISDDICLFGAVLELTDACGARIRLNIQNTTANPVNLGCNHDFAVTECCTPPNCPDWMLRP